MTVLCKAAQDFSKSFMWILLECPFLLKSIFSSLSVCKQSLWSLCCQHDTEEVHVTRCSLPVTGCCFLPLSSWWPLNFVCRVYLARGRFPLLPGTFLHWQPHCQFYCHVFHILAKCFYNENSEFPHWNSWCTIVYVSCLEVLIDGYSK